MRKTFKTQGLLTDVDACTFLCPSCLLFRWSIFQNATGCTPSTVESESLFLMEQAGMFLISQFACVSLISWEVFDSLKRESDVLM